MKMPGLRQSLFPLALCTIIAILVIKLALIVGGAIISREVVSSPPDEVLAGQDQPANAKAGPAEKSSPGLISESYASTPPVDKAAKNLRSNGGSPGETLSFIQQRENELRRKEEQLKEKEERLARIEKEVERKTKELLAIQKEIQSFKTEKQDTQNSKVKSLAKIYGTMKPKEAAKLLENLDDHLVKGIISIMTPDEAASILSIMEVKKAAKISEALSGR